MVVEYGSSANEFELQEESPSSNGFRNLHEICLCLCAKMICLTEYLLIVGKK